MKPGEGYHGDHYKILTAQGKDAPGDVYDYIIGNRMRAGFALVAWPIRYGDTGVTSFMISHGGVLYQKDLGLQSATIAAQMEVFDSTRIRPGTRSMRLDDLVVTSDSDTLGSR